MITMTFAGMNGALRQFEVCGATDVHLDRIKEICSGYPSFQTADGWKFRCNKNMYNSVESYVEAQQRTANRPQRNTSPSHGEKLRLLVPITFDDSRVMTILGDVNLSGRGAAFPIREDHPSIHGEHLLGYEGATGQYVYYTK